MSGTNESGCVTSIQMCRDNMRRILTAAQIRTLTNCGTCDAEQYCPCVSIITNEEMGGVHPSRTNQAHDVIEGGATAQPLDMENRDSQVISRTNAPCFRRCYIPRGYSEVDSVIE